MDPQTLQQLSNPLEVAFIDFKPAQIYAAGDNVYCTLLAYKDARVDMHILDDVCGQQNWQNSYHRDSKGILQCGIGIKCQPIGTGTEWVWKWSNGVPSEYESAKGEYSDAFKRAGFMWGIGRELYEFPRIKVILNQDEYYEKEGKLKASFGFRPNDWDWDMDWEDEETGGFKLIGYQTTREGKKVKRFDNNPYGSKNPRK